MKPQPYVNTNQSKTLQWCIRTIEPEHKFRCKHLAICQSRWLQSKVSIIPLK